MAQDAAALFGHDDPPELAASDVRNAVVPRDPLGLALENFDPTGRYRIKDNGVPVDASGVMYDGTKIDGPPGLREAILKHSDMFVRTFTESLLTYATGRRVEYYDMPTVRVIVHDAERNGNRVSAFILGVVNSPAFRMTKVEPGATTQAQER